MSECFRMVLLPFLPIPSVINLLPALICAPIHIYDRRDENTPICHRKILYVKWIFHSLNVPLIATFCEACQALLLQMKIVFQKSGPLKPAVSAETAYECHCWGLVWFYGSWVAHAGRYPVWARSSRTLALEAISCKIYRHCRNLNGAG